MMTDHNYRLIEELLLRVLSLLSTVFNDSEKVEVHDFIDAGEFGLALETLVDIVIEENKQISDKALILVYELSELMQLDKKVLEEKLSGHVTDS